MSTENTTTIKPPAVIRCNGSGDDRQALQFKIGDRTYWLGRSRDGNAWTIVANGDLVDHASILHYGDVEAFVKVTQRLQQIEALWAARQIASGVA